MLAKERQRCICELVNNNGSAESTELMELFQVSPETIRKDLLILERQGELTRVHGGAIKADAIKPFSAFQNRITENGGKKEVLAKKAADLIAEGDVIGIDTGSTALFLAAAIKERFNDLTVITHSMDIFNELHGVKNFKVILCGGQFLEDERAFCGALTLQMLESLHMKKVFVFPTGISLESGLTDYQENLLPIQKQYLRSAGEVFILADSSKYQKKALYRFSEMKRAFTYVTDDELPSEIRERYEEHHYKII
ncbi:MAG: DeoR/GlpR transcriptional regulator [Clostridia bacterium]|nr:DeoR/GlpR transcriptional regulator [Clostridia bacterium]